MKTLYWLTQDLRLDDNPTLAHAAKTDALVLVFCVNPRKNQSTLTPLILIAVQGKVYLMQPRIKQR
jgi:deoxyribodipyrimidine photolyase